MKRVILAAVTLISVAFVGSANAQTSGNVTVNIKLKPIHTLVINAGATVDLEYTEKQDYLNGKFVDVANHLKIFSTGGFKINVSSDANFTSNPVGQTIAASTVKVTPTAGTEKPIVGAQYTPTSTGLTVNQQEIVSNSAGGRDLTVNVRYTGAGSDDYINKFVATKGNEEHTFTAQVTYTIVAN